MAVDMFLMLDGIKGESNDDTHGEEIDVLSWSWGMAQSGTTHGGGGGGAGKASYQDLSVTAFMEASTVPLMQHLSKGTHIKEGLLVCRKAGDKPLEYYKLAMKEILVTSVSIGGSGGEDRLTKNITLNFREWKATYTPQKEDGSGDAEVEYGRNIAKGADL